MPHPTLYYTQCPSALSVSHAVSLEQDHLFCFLAKGGEWNSGLVSSMNEGNVESILFMFIPSIPVFLYLNFPLPEYLVFLGP